MLWSLLFNQNATVITSLWAINVHASLNELFSAYYNKIQYFIQEDIAFEYP